MNALNQLALRLGASPEWVTMLLALLIGVACALAVTGALLIGGGRADPLRRRLRSLQEPRNGAAPEAKALPAWMGRLQPYLRPHAEKRRVRLNEVLIHAGLRSENALAMLYAAKLASALLLSVLPLFATLVRPAPQLTAGMVAVLMFAFAGIGWLLPNFYVERRADARRRVLMNAFPDALDLLVACTEAGLGLNAAIQRVADQLPASHPLLAAELALVNAEIRAGVDRVAALRRLAERTGLDDIRGLVSLMTQSMRYGTSIADTLRVYAEEFRDRRMQRAEEIAATIGTRLIFPLCFCIFPAFFVVAVGPAVVGVLRVLGGVEWPGGN